MMQQATLTVNGKANGTPIEARTNLADYLREGMYLTATHVGCEHGVCGACTVLVDGCPVRSCITYAAACDGAAVTTLEGLADDPIMADLRQAFADHHALQCGYCTPGMLITCRDIVLRVPDADEKRVRVELAGNLCRCTGYVGIVAATRSVLEKHRGDAERSPARSELGPVGAHAGSASARQERLPRLEKLEVAAPQHAVSDAQWQAVEEQGVELRQAFGVPHERTRVWAFFDDLEKVAGCMPGARLVGTPVDGRADGEMKVKLGPMVSSFAGSLDSRRNEADHHGIVRATGRDGKSGSSAKAVVRYGVEAVGPMQSRVSVSVKFLLAGPLAQISRSGLIKDVADHLTDLFAANLESAMSGRAVPPASQTLDAVAIARATFWRKLRSLFSRRARS